MIDHQTFSSEIARKVLSQETITEVYNLEGRTPMVFSILDRWALNSPDKLKALEAEGTIALLIRLTAQWTLEENTMDSEEFYDLEMQGMTKWEAFKIMGVNTEL